MAVLRINCWFGHKVRQRKRTIMRQTDYSGEVAEKVKQTRQACSCGRDTTAWEDGFTRSIDSLTMPEYDWDTFYEQGWVKFD